MATNVSLDWDVEGVITPRESVEKMLKVFPAKTIEDSGTFWTWEGYVSVLKTCNSDVLN